MILKTKPTEKYSSVDFYMATTDGKGNFNDTWEKVIWSNCFNENGILLRKEWENSSLNLPNNYELKLQRRYGDKWRIPQNNKGPWPRKKII